MRTASLPFLISTESMGNGGSGGDVGPGNINVRGEVVIAGAVTTETEAAARMVVAASGVAREILSVEAAAEVTALLGEVIVAMMRTDADNTSMVTRETSTPAEAAIA